MDVKSKFAYGELPTMAELEDEVCMFHDNVLRHSAAATHTANGVEVAGAIADDRRKQLRSKRKQLPGGFRVPPVINLVTALTTVGLPTSRSGRSYSRSASLT